MKNIIIDCDPGHDDAIAILLALAHKDKLNIKAITTIGGNQTIEKVTKNALKIVELMDENIEVAMGEKGPLTRKLRVAPEAHGITGMDGPELPEPTRKCISTHGVKKIADIVRTSKEKITLVPIGPLTNIAIFIKSYPELLDKIEEISFMGGGINTGNITSAAEFNIYVDPESADIVFKSGIPLVMSGLDVTNKAYVLDNEYEHLRNGGKVSKFVSELLDFYSKYGKLHGYTGNAMHDPCAIMYLVFPEIFLTKDYYVDVVLDSEICRGMTLADKRPKHKNKNNVSVLIDVDREVFVKKLMGAFEILDKRF